MESLIISYERVNDNLYDKLYNQSMYAYISCFEYYMLNFLSDNNNRIIILNLNLLLFIIQLQQKMIYTFSPNWYRQQCLLFTEQFMYYASNAMLYQYDLLQRKIKLEKCFKNIQYGGTNKDIKITCISQDLSNIIVGFNQSVIVFLSKDKFQQKIFKIQSKGPLDLLYVINPLAQNSQLICDINGIIKLTRQQNQSKFIQKRLTTRESQNNKVKKIIKYQHQHKHQHQKSTQSLLKQSKQTSYLVFNLKGRIQIFDSLFQNKIKCIQLIGQSILSVDVDNFGGSLAFLTKRKDQYFINIYNIGSLTLTQTLTAVALQQKSEKKQQEPVKVELKQYQYQGQLNLNQVASKNNQVKNKQIQQQQNSQKSKQNQIQHHLHQSLILPLPQTLTKIQQNAKITIQVRVIYPKKYHQKLKQNSKACMTIKFISSTQIILTGKLGQIFSIYPQKIKQKQKQKISLYPYSLNEQNQLAQVWSDSKHYKQIYAIYESNQKIYMIGTDHILSVWTRKSNQLKYVYSIKFLTSPVCQIFFSQPDPRTIFTLLKDSIIRSCSPLESGCHYLSEHWKFSTKFKISRAIMSIHDIGISGLITKCNKVLLYDIFEDRLMKIFDLKEQVNTISFQNDTIKNAIQILYQSKFIKSEITNSSYFMKKLYLNVALVIQLRQKVMLIQDYHSKQLKSFQIFKKQKLQRLYETKYWDEQLLLGTKKSSENIHFAISNGKNRISSKIELSLQNSRYMFKRYSSQKFYLINYKNNKILISNIKAQFQTNTFDVELIEQIVLSHHIQNVVFNHVHNLSKIKQFESDFVPKLALHNQKQQVFQIVQLKVKEDNMCNFCQVSTFKVDSKIECLSFYENRHMIIAFKNQTLKIVDYENYYQEDLKNKKNNKDKKLEIKVKQRLIQNEVFYKQKKQEKQDKQRI